MTERYIIVEDDQGYGYRAVVLSNGTRVDEVLHRIDPEKARQHPIPNHHKERK